MADYNSDKERHVDHKFVVQSAWPNSPKEIMTSKGLLKANEQGRMLIKDESLAREIQREHPTDLAVTRMRMSKPADQGHRYHFAGWPEMPWAKYDEFGRRIKEVTNGNTIRENDSDDSRDSGSSGSNGGGRTADGEGATGEHE